MFYCQFCGALVPRGVSCKLVVTKHKTVRADGRWLRVPKTERNMLRTWRDLPRKQARSRSGRTKFIEVFVPDHPTRQIAEEKRACPACAATKP